MSEILGQENEKRKTETEVMVEVLITFGKIFGAKSIEEYADIALVWLSFCQEVEGFSVELLQAAGRHVVKTRKEYWPTPAVLIESMERMRDADRPRRSSLPEHQPIRELPSNGPPCTPEQRAEILRNRPKAAKMLEVVLGGEEGETVKLNHGLRSVSGVKGR